MRLGNYTFEIVAGTERTGGYVALIHGQKYSVRLQNHGTRKCDAKLVIDATEMGTFRVDPGKQVEIEHPSHSNGCFTFFELATPEAHAAGLKSMPQTGLVSVTFMPEFQQGVTLASPPAASSHSRPPRPGWSDIVPKPNPPVQSESTSPPETGPEKTTFPQTPETVSPSSSATTSTSILARKADSSSGSCPIPSAGVLCWHRRRTPILALISLPSDRMNSQLDALTRCVTIPLT